MTGQPALFLPPSSKPFVETQDLLFAEARDLKAVLRPQTLL